MRSIALGSGNANGDALVTTVSVRPIEREAHEHDRVLEWAHVSGSARMLRSGNVGLAYRDARLASFSCDNGHKLSLDPRTQGPTFRRAFLLYIVLEDRIAGKCVGPCHL